jgi:hypothetical protein
MVMFAEFRCAVTESEVTDLNLITYRKKISKLYRLRVT